MTPRRRILLIGLASVLVGLIWMLALLALEIASVSGAPGGGDEPFPSYLLPFTLAAGGILAMIASLSMRKE